MSPIRSWPNSACVGTPKISVMAWRRAGYGRADAAVPAAPLTFRSSRGNARCLFHQRAFPVLERTECLLGRDRRLDLVVVPRCLRLGGLLDLHEIRRVDLAAVDADRALAEQRV